MPISELDARMSVPEMKKWQAYYMVEPFGDRTQHIMLAQLTALLFNINRDPKKGKALQHHDFDLFESRFIKEVREHKEGRAWVTAFKASAEAHNQRIRKENASR